MYESQRNTEQRNWLFTSEKNVDKSLPNNRLPSFQWETVPLEKHRISIWVFKALSKWPFQTSITTINSFSKRRLVTLIKSFCQRRNLVVSMPLNKFIHVKDYTFLHRRWRKANSAHLKLFPRNSRHFKSCFHQPILYDFLMNIAATSCCVKIPEAGRQSRHQGDFV